MFLRAATVQLLTERIDDKRNRTRAEDKDARNRPQMRRAAAAALGLGLLSSFLHLASCREPVTAVQRGPTAWPSRVPFSGPEGAHWAQPHSDSDADDSRREGPGSDVGGEGRARQDRRQAGGQTKCGTDCDCRARWCAGDFCLEGAQEVGAGGFAVCRDGIPCKEVPLGCEICPAPIFSVAQAGVEELAKEFQAGLRGVEAGMKVLSFEDETGIEFGGIRVGRDQATSCSLLCWTEF